MAVLGSGWRGGPAARRQAVRSGMVLIDSTTCDPTATRIVSAALAARGCAMIDAALGRMSKEAKEGPSFAPEILRRGAPGRSDAGEAAQAALVDLAEEGVTQVFRPLAGGQWIVGVVGPLQLDVLSARIAAEYGIAAGFEAAPFETARWVSAEDPAALQRFVARHRASIAENRDGAPVYLARNAWDLNRRIEDWPALRFSATRERT